MGKKATKGFFRSGPVRESYEIFTTALELGDKGAAQEASDSLLRIIDTHARYRFESAANSLKRTHPLKYQAAITRQLTRTQKAINNHAATQLPEWYGSLKKMDSLPGWYMELN